MSYQYAQTGPPFNFLGHLSESQKEAFAAWVKESTAELPKVQTFHQIRAQQLRKTAGMLEAFYGDAGLGPSFVKESWTPSADGHFPYAFRNDHEPAMVVGRVKEFFRSKLVSIDDAVFQMNQVRTLIERHEDLAQYSREGVDKVPALMNRLETLFGQPEYQAALVKDKSDQYQGKPRFRVHQLDDPTPWERDTRSGRTPRYAAANDTSSLGTRLTVQALHDSAAASIPIQVPQNYPVSPDLENRLNKPGTTPPLLDRAEAGWDTFVLKAKAAGNAVMGKPQADE